MRSRLTKVVMSCGGCLPRPGLRVEAAHSGERVRTNRGQHRRGFVLVRPMMGTGPDVSTAPLRFAEADASRLRQPTDRRRGLVRIAGTVSSVGLGVVRYLAGRGVSGAPRIAQEASP